MVTEGEEVFFFSLPNFLAQILPNRIPHRLPLSVKSLYNFAVRYPWLRKFIDASFLLLVLLIGLIFSFWLALGLSDLVSTYNLSTGLITVTRTVYSRGDSYGRQLDTD